MKTPVYTKFCFPHNNEGLCCLFTWLSSLNQSACFPVFLRLMHARLMRRIKYSAAFWPLNRRRQQSTCSISASSFLLRNAPQAELMRAAAAEDNSLWDGSAAQRVIKLLLPWALDLLSLTRIQRAAHSIPLFIIYQQQPWLYHSLLIFHSLGGR